MMMSRQSVLTPEQQLKVMALVWGKPEEAEDGWVFLPWIPGHARNKEERLAGWHEHSAFKWPEDQNKILDHLRAHKMDELYFTPNVFTGRSRVANYVAEERVLYADLDESDPRFLDPDLKPTIAWMTSSHEGNERFQGIWILDRMHIGASERFGLNHRLSAYVGADMSGWDSTQVLRVPGRPNFKWEYKDEDGRPSPGALLWVREKRFSTDWLEERLPILAGSDLQQEVEDAEIDAVDRREVWSRVRLKVSHNVRQYMAMRPWEAESGDHDRSDVLWQIERDLADAGCTVAEIVAIVRASPWNKFAGRSNELTQLKSEAVKAKAEVLNASDEDSPLESEDAKDRLADGPIWLDELVAAPRTRPSWLVHNIWAKQSVGFISGAPKSYKSYFALDLAISVATGTPFLNDAQFSTAQGPVLYLQEEDSESTVLHRVEQILEQKAPDRFWRGQIVRDDSAPLLRVSGRSVTSSGASYVLPTERVPLALHVRKQFRVSNPSDQSWLLDFVTTHQFVLVIIDTLGTTVGDIDTDKSGPLNERVLKPLKEISERAGCAIAIVHHNRKPNDNGKTRSGQQMLGSTALHAWVESALYVQSKDMLTGRAASEVKIDRENKLAEDMKMRIRIPTMFQEKGSGEEGARQLWEPEVLLGWAEDSDSTQEVKAAQETEKRGNGGLKLSQFLAAEGYLGKAMTVAEIAKVKGMSEKQILVQLRAGALAGNFIEHEDGTYEPV
jgi:RecA-family ATPase